jgi:hypothetical protein
VLELTVGDLLHQKLNPVVTERLRIGEAFFASVAENVVQSAFGVDLLILDQKICGLENHLDVMHLGSIQGESSTLSGPLRWRKR